MRIERRKRVARALLAALIAAGPPASAAAAPGRDAGVTARPAGRPASAVATPATTGATTAVAAGCPTRVSCGGSCVAELSTGFCILAVKWSGAARIGGVQIGPTIRAECYICECWYIYTNSSGNRNFKRTTDLDCDASVGDLHVV